MSVPSQTVRGQGHRGSKPPQYDEYLALRITRWSTHVTAATRQRFHRSTVPLPLHTERRAVSACAWLDGWPHTCLRVGTRRVDVFACFANNIVILSWLRRRREFRVCIPGAMPNGNGVFSTQTTKRTLSSRTTPTTPGVSQKPGSECHSNCMLCCCSVLR